MCDSLSSDLNDIQSFPFSPCHHNVTQPRDEHKTISKITLFFFIKHLALGFCNRKRANTSPLGWKSSRCLYGEEWDEIGLEAIDRVESPSLNTKSWKSQNPGRHGPLGHLMQLPDNCGAVCGSCPFLGHLPHLP
jgi:hypothetical protein